MLEISYVPISVEISSTFACNVTKPLSSYKILSFGADLEQANINLTITPNVTTPKNATLTHSYLGYRRNNLHNEIYKLDTLNGEQAIISKYVVNFDNLIKLNTNQNDLTELLNNEFTNSINGQFLFNIKTVKKNNFDIAYVKLLISNFLLEPGLQISKNKILSLLDAIFIYWLKSINIMQVTITYCHHNCHTNNFFKATSHEILVGCMACNKISITPYSAGTEESDYNPRLTIHAYTTVNNKFIVGRRPIPPTLPTELTQLMSFTANIDKWGNYPLFKDFKNAAGVSITKLSTLFEDITHYTFTKNFTYYSIPSDADENMDAYAVGNLDKNDPIEYTISATLADNAYGILGDFVMMTGISSNTYTYSFIDEGNTKRKISINLYFGTILPPATTFIPDNGYYDYDDPTIAPPQIQEQKAEILKLENFIREGLVARKHYTGIKTDDNTDSPTTTGEVIISGVKKLYIAYKYDLYMIKAFVDGTGDKVYDEEMNEDYKMKQIKTWIREDTNDFIKDYGGEITEDSYTYKFSRILGISACQYPTGSDIPDPRSISEVRPIPGNNKILSGGTSYYISVKASQKPVNVVLVDINSPPDGIPARCYSYASVDAFKWGSISANIIIECNTHCANHYQYTLSIVPGKTYYIDSANPSAGTATATEYWHVLYAFSSFNDTPTSGNTKINEDKHYHITIVATDTKEMYKVVKADGSEWNIAEYMSYPGI